MKYLIFLASICAVGVFNFAHAAGSYHTYSCIVNGTPNLVTVNISEVDNYDWEHSSRPDDQFSGKSIFAYSSICADLELNTHASGGNPWRFTLKNLYNDDKISSKRILQLSSFDGAKFLKNIENSVSDSKYDIYYSTGHFGISKEIEGSGYNQIITADPYLQKSSSWLSFWQDSIDNYPPNSFINAQLTFGPNLGIDVYNFKLQPSPRYQ